MKKKPTTPLMARKIVSIRATGLMLGLREHGHEEAPDAEAQPGNPEREPLGRGPEHRGEQLLRPRLVEGLSGQRGPDAEEEDVREDDRGGEREDEEGGRTQTPS